MNYSMGGPVIKGTFISKITGQEVYVRDAIQMDNHMTVILQDGRNIPINDFYNEYYQMSTEVYDERGNIIGNSPQNDLEYHEENHLNKDLVFKGMDMPEQSFIDPSVLGPGTIYDGPTGLDKVFDTVNKVPEGVQLVSKLLNKVNEPTIKIEFIWDDFPKEQIKMLKDFYDVTDEDITQAIFNKYLSYESINADCMNQIKNYISSNI